MFRISLRLHLKVGIFYVQVGKLSIISGLTNLFDFHICFCLSMGPIQVFVYVLNLVNHPLLDPPRAALKSGSLLS